MLRLVLLAILAVGLVAGCAERAEKGKPAARTQPAAAKTASGPARPPASAPATAPALAPLPPHNPTDVMSFLQDRLRKLENVIVVYKTKTTYPPLGPGEKAIVRPEGKNFSIVRLTGTREWIKGFLRLGDRYRYESKTTAITDDPRGPDWWPETSTQINAYSPDVSEYLGLDREGKPVRGVIYPPRPLPHPEIEIALGLRAHGQTDMLDAQALSGMSIGISANGKFTMTATDNEQFTHKWTYLREHGYALAKYHRIPPADKTVHQEAVMGDFRQAGDIIMPYSMTLASKTIRGGVVQRVNVSTEATVLRYVIGSDENTPVNYRIRWPDGTRLYDKRKPASQPATSPATQPATAPATQSATAAATRPAD